MIPPGETIGILGGGQLGRMLAMAAAQLGYRCHVFAPERDSIAAEVTCDFTCAAFEDEDALRGFAATCAVITYEFENVPVAPLSVIGDVPVLPHPRALETAQDRLAEKRFCEALGGRPAPYMAVDDRADFAAAIAMIGAPGILKTRRDGYDGKGQWRIADAGDARPPDEAFAMPSVYEAMIDFAAEFSVLLCRGEDGDLRFWDTPQNVHKSGILARSTVPASVIAARQVVEARELAARIAEALDYVGVLACEFFATAEGSPVFNEMAPRVHNSGHWTIEGAITSQFENHIRAICGLPLGDTALAAKGVEMRNIIGDAAEDWAQILADPDNRLHLYGKAAARPGRKMGHVTRLILS